MAWGVFVMDNSGSGAELSFCEFLRIGENNEDLPGVSTPDAGSQPYEQSESEQRESDQFEPSVGGNTIDNHVTDDSSFLDASTTKFDIDRSVRIALQGQSVAAPKQLWESGIWQKRVLLKLSICLVRNFIDRLAMACQLSWRETLGPQRKVQEFRSDMIKLSN